MRRILIVRHAIAMERVEAAEAGIDYAERPLTKDGWRKMKEIAEGLRPWVPELHLVATSPWLRAVQTAEILAGAYDAKVKENALLLPDQGHDELLAWIGQVSDKKQLAIVGHEPSLSRWAGWVLTGRDAALFPLKKGGACLIEFADALLPGQATLSWLMTPAQLRRCGH
jgi:phosphohistidine phosphatase